MNVIVTLPSFCDLVNSDCIGNVLKSSVMKPDAVRQYVYASDNEFRTFDRRPDEN
jgi:hypothetical protein